MKRFLIDAQLQFEETLYLQRNTGGIYFILKVTVNDFLPYFAYGTSRVSVQQYSASILDFYLP